VKGLLQTCQEGGDHAQGCGSALTRRYRLIVSLCLSLCLCSFVSYAGQQQSILLIRSENSAVYSDTEKAFTRQIDEQCKQLPSCPHIQSIPVSAITSAMVNEPDLIVSIGQRASRKASNLYKGRPQLHVLVSRTGHAASHRHSSVASAIYLEQPLDRQLAFIRFLMPERRRLGVLINSNSHSQVAQLEAVARKRGFELVISTVESPKLIGKRLHGLKNKIDVLLAIPDPAIFNRNTLASILITAYKDRIPVIGFSESMIKAGAIAGTYSSPDTVGTEAAEKALKLLATPSHSDTYPALFEIRVNRRVANALHIRLPTDSDIQRWGKGQ